MLATLIATHIATQRYGSAHRSGLTKATSDRADHVVSCNNTDPCAGMLAYATCKVQRLVEQAPMHMSVILLQARADLSVRYCRSGMLNGRGGAIWGCECRSWPICDRSLGVQSLFWG